MDTVWKFHITKPEGQTISIPKTRKFLTARWTGTGISIWAEVYSKSEVEEVEIKILATGEVHHCTDERWLSYIHTVFDDTTGFVWHVYEVTKRVKIPRDKPPTPPENEETRTIL